MTIEIRLATSNDTLVVRELVRAAYTRYIERIGKEPAPMLEDYAPLIANGEVWVAVEDTKVLGALVIRVVGDYLFVGNVAVKPDQQGKGLGRALIAFAEEEAKRYGLRELRLYTNEKMYENLAVYDRLGFEETERKWDGGYRRVFMRKRVS